MCVCSCVYVDERIREKRKIKESVREGVSGGE